MTRIIFYLLLTVIVMQGCIEPFSPVIDEYQEMLVIDGLITDKEGIHTVTVSRSSLFDSPGLDYESGCNVSILDNNGNVLNMTEKSPGIYSIWLDQQFP